MGGQPGKPKPPGDPPGPREPQRPPPVEEPPRPIPVPPVDRPPPPMQVYPEPLLDHGAAGRMPSEPARRACPPLSQLSAAHRAVDAGLGGLFHQLSLEPARRYTPTPSVDRVLMLEPAVELAQHRCRIGRSFITVRARPERALEEVAIPRRRQEFAPVQGHQAGSSWPMHLRP
jgi:hypothetical protein